MSPEISERAFEASIEATLLSGGPDALPDSGRAAGSALGDYSFIATPGGYRKRRPDDYDRKLCLIPRDVLDFVYATRPKEWEKLKAHHGPEVKEKFLARLSREIAQRGALDVLRKGIKDSACKFQLAYFRPSSGLNEALSRLYEANLFSIVRQLKYSEKNENSLDLALFLNGVLRHGARRWHGLHRAQHERNS